MIAYMNVFCFSDGIEGDVLMAWIFHFFEIFVVRDILLYSTLVVILRFAHQLLNLFCILCVKCHVGLIF